MSIDIPAELEPFVQELIGRGQCHSANEVVAEALKVYREVNRRREQLRSEIHAGLASETVPGDIAFAELDRLSQQFQTKGE